MWLRNCSWRSLGARWLCCASYVDTIAVMHVHARQSRSKGTLQSQCATCSVQPNCIKQDEAIHIIMSFDLQVRLITSSVRLQAWQVVAKLGHLQGLAKPLIRCHGNRIIIVRGKDKVVNVEKAHT